MRNVALCVGVNYYAYAGCLEECVKDATSMMEILATNGDGSPNFEVKKLLADSEENPVTRSMLRSEVEELFQGKYHTALFYFSGHGASNKYGSYLCTSESMEIEDGLSMDTLMHIVSQSNALNKVIILDSCHSGKLGDLTRLPDSAMLPDNTTVLAACSGEGVSYEGIFTPLVVSALDGGAMNLVGEVTPGSLYSYVDRILGVIYQHPVFKANIDSFVCLRICEPPIDRKTLRRISTLFENPDWEYQLDPSYEEDKRDSKQESRNLEHEEIFAVMRQYVSLNLVVPVKETYMYWAAVNSDSLRLTKLGQYYWRLAKSGRI